MKAPKIYEIFSRHFQGWPPFEGLQPQDQKVFLEMAACNADSDEITIQNVRAHSWCEETLNNGKAILRVRFSVVLDGLGLYADWTCWLDDLFKDGKPSSSLRGLINLGVTDKDIGKWASGSQPLEGLNRNLVRIIVEHDRFGYLAVKYVNALNYEMTDAPLPLAQRKQAAQRVLEAMRLRKDGRAQSAPSGNVTLAPTEPIAPTQQDLLQSDDIPF